MAWCQSLGAVLSWFVSLALTAEGVPPSSITFAEIGVGTDQTLLDDAALLEMLVDETNADPDVFPNTTVRVVVLDEGSDVTSRVQSVQTAYQRERACLTFGWRHQSSSAVMGALAKTHNSNHGFFLDTTLGAMPQYTEFSNTFGIDGWGTMVKALINIAESLKPPLKRWGLILTESTTGHYDNFVQEQALRGNSVVYSVIQNLRRMGPGTTLEEADAYAQELIDGAVAAKANIFFMCFCLVYNTYFKAQFLRRARDAGLFGEGYQWFTYYRTVRSYIEPWIYQDEFADLWPALDHFKILDVTDFEPADYGYASNYRETQLPENTMEILTGKIQTKIDEYNPALPYKGYSSLSWLNCSLPEHAATYFCNSNKRPQLSTEGHRHDGVKHALHTLHKIIYDLGHHDFCDVDVRGRRTGDPQLFTRELLAVAFDGYSGHRRFQPIDVAGGAVPALSRTWQIRDWRPAEARLTGGFRSQAPSLMHTNVTASQTAPITERVLHRDFYTARPTVLADIGWMGNTTVQPGDWYHDMCGPGARVDQTRVDKRCIPCSAGDFNAPGDGVDSCAPVEAFRCPEGTELAPALALSGIPCRPCLPGFFANGSSCLRCLEGTFQGSPGSSTCHKCPEGRTTRFQGALSIDDCMCPPGTFVDSTDHLSCSTCGTGLRCSRWSMEFPEAEPGHMISTDFGARGGHGLFPAFRCYGDSTRCPGGPPDTCAEGRTGLGCSLCLEGRSDAGDGTCEPCGDFSAARFAIAIVCVLTLMGLLFRDSFRRNLVVRNLDTLFLAAALGVLVTTLQTLSVIRTLPFKWGSPVDEIFAVTQLVVLDIDVLQPDCVLEPDSFSRYVMLVLCVPLCLAIVLLYYLVFRCTRFGHGISPERLDSGLRNTAGVLCSVTFTSYMALLCSAFQCEKHPTGVTTMFKYETVVCWSSEEHTAILFVACQFMLLPVTFLSTCVWAVAKLPGKSAAGDVRFFQRWSFLFLRFKAQCSWFALVLLGRGFLLPLTSAFSDPVPQIFSMQVILQAFVALLCIFQPWKTKYVNVLDVAVNIPAALIVGATPFFVPDADRNFAAMFTAACCFCCILVIPFILLGKLTIMLLTRGRRRFQYFLCHHKEAAGYFARLLKVGLQQGHAVKREVFLDCDNLSDLTTLFGYVREHTDTLVVICTKHLLRRPWCMGEVAAADQARVKIVLLCFPDFSFPLSKDDRDNYSRHTPGGACLAEHGIDDSMLAEAMEAMEQCPRIGVPSVVNAPTLQALVGAIHASVSVTVEQVAGPAAPADAEVAILADADDTEAASAGFVVRALLAPMSTNAARIPFVLCPRQTIPRSVADIIVVCSDGCLWSPHVQSALLHAATLRARCVPVVIQQNFDFPAQPLLEKLQKQVDRAGTPLPRLDEGEWKASAGAVYANVVAQLFNQIAVFMSASDTEKLLGARAVQIFNRMSMNAGGELEVSVSAASFMDGASESQGAASTSAPSYMNLVSAGQGAQEERTSLEAEAEEGEPAELAVVAESMVVDSKSLPELDWPECHPTVSVEKVQTQAVEESDKEAQKVRCTVPL